MYRENQTEARIRDAGDSLPRTSNNAFGKERDAEAWEWLNVHPSTARQLVEAGKFPNIAKARKRLNAGEKRGIVRIVGLVNLMGFEEKLRATNPVNKAQHEGELTELCLRFLRLAGVTTIRRGLQVDQYLPDAEIDMAENTIYLEHDRSTMGYGELLQRIKGYADCGRDVLWSMQSQTRIEGIIGYARRHDYELPPSMWFGIYRNLLANIAGPWTNAEGQEINL